MTRAATGSPSIRPYRPTDLGALLDVWRRASDLAHPFLSADFQDRDAVKIAQDHLPRADTWVALDGGTLVGFITLAGDEVAALFVDPAHHRRGFGTALVDHARSLRPRLELDVFEGNAIGRRFYERYGFRTVARGVHEETGLDVLRLELTRAPGPPDGMEGR